MKKKMEKNKAKIKWFIPLADIYHIHAMLVYGGWKKVIQKPLRRVIFHPWVSQEEYLHLGYQIVFYWDHVHII